ncbi:MAG TPA: ROK family protein [Planctomycetaceae bacterium]|nr:ROK family protein [Planctomycetaceae bacterium]
MTAPTPSGPWYLGIDLGGTNVRSGVVSHSGEVLSRTTARTSAYRGPEAGVANIVRLARQAVADSGLEIDQIAAVGLATPGTMDIPAGTLVRPHNLPGWDDLPIRQLVADALGRPIVLQNDANAAAYGEYWIGAGRDAHSLVFWTLGTGIGCGIIVADMIIAGEHSHGSECGHIVIQMDGGRSWHTGQSGTLEAYASATALIQRCGEALSAGRETILHDWIAAGEELTPVLIGRAASQADPLAEELIMNCARALGVGTTSLMHTIDPALVLIGGAMTFGRNDSPLGRRFLARVRAEVNARAFPVPAAKTVIDYATLGGDAGFIGAAGCARREFAT